MDRLGPLLCLVLAVINVAGRWKLQTVIAASPSFCAAYFKSGQGPSGPPRLSLFPKEGPEILVPLPDELSINFRLIAFSPDGKSVYGQKGNLLGPTGDITKIEFKPARQSVVPGSVGLGAISFLTVSQPSGKLFVSGRSKRRGYVECGAFEIDPDTAAFRTLRVGIYPDCGGAVGPISPDGKSILSYSGKELSLLDLDTGAVHLLGSGLTQGSWSPDGRWIAAWGAGRIVLIDATNISKRRKLGTSGENIIRWSPDSKSLLIMRSHFWCWYAATLEAVSVETGRRSLINSSRCRIATTEIGWMDREAVR